MCYYKIEVKYLPGPDYFKPISRVTSKECKYAEVPLSGLPFSEALGLKARWVTSRPSNIWALYSVVFIPQAAEYLGSEVLT